MGIETISKLRKNQMKALKRIVQKMGIFYDPIYEGHGSLALCDGKCILSVDFTTGSAGTTIPHNLGEAIASAKEFKDVDEIYNSGIKIWPLQTKRLF